MTEPPQSATDHELRTTAPQLSTRLGRRANVDQVFDPAIPTNPSLVEFNRVLWKYEDCLTKEARIWWNVISLKKYLQEGVVPRGLRLRKTPTTVFSTKFQAEWDSILTKASLSLISLIVTEEENKLKVLQQEVAKASEDLEHFRHLHNYSTNYHRVEEKLEKLEEQIAATKRSKFLRDSEDFQTGKVYAWFQSTLKKFSKPNKNTFNRTTSKKNVNQAVTHESRSENKAYRPDAEEYRKTKRSNKDSGAEDNSRQSKNDKGPLGQEFQHSPQTDQPGGPAGNTRTKNLLRQTNKEP